MARRIAILSERAEPELVAALAEAGYDGQVIGPGPDLAARLAAFGPDIAFNALTSAIGRSGRIQGLLEVMALPYTQSGVLASALAADRHQAKIALRAAGVPVTDHVVAERAAAARQHELPPPYIAKPVLAGTGQSGILAANADLPPPEALRVDAWAGGEMVMVERFLVGRTLEVAVMGGVALGVRDRGVPATAGLIGDGENEAGERRGISPNIYEKLQKISLKAHEVLGCRGVVRVRFRYNDQASGESGLVCLDVDTQPDLTPAALVPEQARIAGHSYSDLVAWMVEDASCNR